jgi:methionine aminotransferase
VLADYSQVSNLTEAEFAKKLVTEYGVASIPVSVFYDAPVEHQVVRFCFAKEDRTLQQALARFSALSVTAMGS